jgi:hypothetical protein
MAVNVRHFEQGDLWHELVIEMEHDGLRGSPAEILRRL